MTVKTIFSNHGQLELGEVEVRLLPGIPHLHIVGLPQASIRECGIKVKSALRACGLEWPAGQQIVVALRPADVPKSGSGVELAIALAFLARTKQLSPELLSRLPELVVYGELALDGRVLAPPQLESALALSGGHLLTGTPRDDVRDGRWLEIASLAELRPTTRVREFDWDSHWSRPVFPELEWHPSSVRDLLLALHMRLHMLVAGPQGSGKTTWAKLLHALSPAPDPDDVRALMPWFGDEALATRWRPLEQPHHGTTLQALVGGGAGARPGVITRAHGGILLMDEFLEFPPRVLEALREPVESGSIEIARSGCRQRYPARFQLVGTTNLCPCGQLNPLDKRPCGYALPRCRSTTVRMSGPLLDRFDLLTLSHEWTGPAEEGRVSSSEVLARAERLAAFRQQRGLRPVVIPDWAKALEVSHRRRNSMVKVARGLADLESMPDVLPHHFMEAYAMVVSPMQRLREVFA